MSEWPLPCNDWLVCCCVVFSALQPVAVKAVSPWPHTHSNQHTSTALMPRSQLYITGGSLIMTLIHKKIVIWGASGRINGENPVVAALNACILKRL